MGLRFVIGATGAGKSQYVYQNVIEESKKNPKKNYLIIVPDQFTMQTQLDLVNLHPDKGIMNIDVLSFGRLSHRIFEEVGGSYQTVLDDTGKNLVLRKVAQECKSDLLVMKNHIHRAGYVSEIKSVISELMQYGISIEDLDKMIEYSQNKGALYYKLKDIRTLYQKFEGFIKERFLTTEETLDFLRRVLNQSNIVKDSVVVFDGFTGFTPVQSRVIQEIMLWAQEVIVTITMDAEEKNWEPVKEQELFYLSKKTMADLKKRAEQVSVKCEKSILLKGKPVYRLKDNPALSHLEQELFRFHQNQFTEKQDSIKISEMTTPQEEVRQIALQMKELIRKEKYAFRDIAVVTGDLSKYASLVEVEFPKYGIPFFIDQTNGIVLNPFTELIRSALLVVENDFSYESVFHFLRCGLVDLEPEETDRLENYVLVLGIRGKKAWSNRFTRKTKEMLQETREIEEIERIREKIFGWFEPIMLKEASAENFVKSLYRFLVNQEVETKLWNYAEGFEKEGNLQKAKEYDQIYELVCKLLDQIVGILGQETLKLKEFREILDSGFSELKVGSIPQNVDRVVIGDIERTRLRKIKALFFIGINDGVIPKTGSTGGIISDLDREFLQQSEWELAPTPRQQMFIQRLYLYINMTKPIKRLFLSYAKVDQAGKSLRPAYLISTIQKMFSGLEVTYPQLCPLEDQIDNQNEGLDYLIGLLRRYASGLPLKEQEGKLFFTLYNSYQEQKEYQELLHQLTEAAFYHYDEQILPREIAKQLYGKLLKNSVSRLEKYAACAYAHFLQYGLQIQERDKYQFETVDMGNVFHAVLEGFSHKLEEKDLTWFDFSSEDGNALLKEVLDEYAVEYGETILFSSKRNEYVIKRMQRILERTIHTLQYQLRQGLFKPDQFEVSFQMADSLESVNIALTDEEKMQIIGRIDRVDTYEENDQVYVKVIDYKSGNRKFDLAALYYGLQLQLVVYMNAALEMKKKENPEKKIIPAAMLYYHVEDPMTETYQGAPSTEEINQALLEQLKMTGIVNEDEKVVKMLDTDFETKSTIIPVGKKKDGSYTSASSTMQEEDFSAVSRFMQKKIKDIGRSIVEGKMDKRPYEQGNQNACTYCQYASVCGFDEKIPGYQYRKLEEISQEQALEKIKEEVENKSQTERCE